MSKQDSKPKSKKTKSSDTSVEDLDFEASLAELESIVGDLELGQVGLTESLEQYEMGVKYLKHCYQILEKAEKRVQILNGTNADGSPKTEPFSDDESESLAEKADNRSRRRSAAHKSTPKPKRPAGEDNVDVPGGLF